MEPLSHRGLPRLSWIDTLYSNFSYGVDDYDGEGNEEQKGPPEGSETMPYIDESPTMSPQLSARSQGGGDSISPTPPEGLAPGHCYGNKRKYDFTERNVNVNSQQNEHFGQFPKDRFPAVNSLIQRINLRKRRDSLILGGVVGICTILLLLYAFH